MAIAKEYLSDSVYSGHASFICIGGTQAESLANGDVGNAKHLCFGRKSDCIVTYNGALISYLSNLGENTGSVLSGIQQGYLIHHCI